MFSKPTLTTLVFDWGDTVMKTYPEYSGAMINWPKVAAVDGVQPALAALDGKYRIEIGTNAQDSSASQIKSALDRVEIGRFFEHVLTFAETRARKPDTSFFRAIERILGEYREGILMIGDSYQVDIIGAKKAGWKAAWYNPQNLACPGCQPAHEIEIDNMEDLVETVNKPTPPDLATCFLWLQENRISANILVHSQIVAAAAYQLALWVRASGGKVDPVLAHRGGLLHDVCKLHKETGLDHGAAAGEFLTNMGEPALGQIAERHMLFGLLDPKRKPVTWEEKLVYYADKLVEKNQLVLVEERLAGLKKRYPMEPGLMSDLMPELRKFEMEICKAIGASPEQLLVDLQKALHA